MTTAQNLLAPALSRYRLLPVIVVQDVSDAIFLADVLVEAGLPVAEVTLRTPAAVDAIRAMTDRGGILVGAGTVLTSRQVDEAIGAGARFIVSPGTSRTVIERCQDLGIPALPGAVTATEMQAALELDVQTVKFFPAHTCGGAGAIKALSAAFSSVRFVPTGGVGPDNLAGYLGLAPVVAVGGSWMVPPDMVAARRRESLTQLIRSALTAAHRTSPADCTDMA